MMDRGAANKQHWLPTKGVVRPWPNHSNGRFLSDRTRRTYISIFIRLIAFVSYCVLAFPPVCIGQQPDFIPFVITTQAEVRYGGESGMLMFCPAHLHGTSDQAMAKLAGLLEAGTKAQNQPSTIYVCQVNQQEVLARFAPMVERIIVTPYVPYQGPRANDPLAALIWPNQNHAMLNALRRIREICPGKQLLARIQPDGEPTLFQGRSPSFEELQWQILAVCGAGYQGISWRGGLTDPLLAKRLADYCQRITENAGELSVASPVAWVEADRQLPVAALQTSSKLFIVLLHPQFMNVSIKGGRQIVRFPEKNIEVVRGTLRLSPPPGLRIVRATTLLGQPLSLHPDGDGASLVRFSLTKGGEMLIIDTEGQSEIDTNTAFPRIQFRAAPVRSADTKWPRANDLAEGLLQPSGADDE